MLVGLRPFVSSSSETVVTPPTPTGPVDPYYSSVYGLYHLDTDYADSGPGGRSIQATNGVARRYAIHTTGPKFGAGSLRCTNGNTGGTLIKIPPSPSLNSTGDFTFEFWLRTDGSQGQYSNVFQTMGASTLGSTPPPATGLGIVNYTDAAGTGTGGVTLSAFLGSGETSLRLTSTSNPNTGSYNHIALTRQGSTCTLWFNGVAERSGSYSAPLDLGQNYGMTVGRYTNTDNGNIFNGWIDDIRITLGVARYTSNFTIPSDAFPNSG